MIRQNIKNQEYFLKYFRTLDEQIIRRKKSLEDGLVVADRLSWFKQNSLSIFLDYSIATYTVGAEMSIVKKEFEKVLDYLHEGWSTNNVKFKDNNKIYDQYTLSAYDQMLWMLSLGYLLDIANEDFQKLVDVIDRDCVKDFLFEFIIRAKIKDRKPIIEESYESGWILFGKLRQATTEMDKAKAEKLAKDFITKDWYKEHKDTGWYNCHNNPHNTYFGYWSFETAAVVKIMGLDDSSFRDCQYYPKDLVNFSNEQITE